MTIMAPEKALPSIIELVNQCSFANASRYVRIIRVEKVIFLELEVAKKYFIFLFVIYSLRSRDRVWDD